MIQSVAEALLTAYGNHDARRVLVIGACGGVDWPRGWSLYQIFKPEADALIAAGYEPQTEITGIYDAVLVLMPKNRVEAEYWLARALSHIDGQGMIYAAAANDAGGKRLGKIFEAFGLIDAQNISKNKARVVWAHRPATLSDTAQKSLQAGAMQPVLEGAYQAQPGIFGWDKIDAGSRLLAEHLPEKLKGRGADFGCGYGYLTRVILERGAGIKTLYAIDADARAIAAAGLNIDDPRVVFDWRDLTKNSGLKNLDFIVMNPPFHAGKKADSDIGIAFIQQARAALRDRRGELYLVANNQLPYEAKLRQLFFQVDKIYEGQGFKVYKAMT